MQADDTPGCSRMTRPSYLAVLVGITAALLAYTVLLSYQETQYRGPFHDEVVLFAPDLPSLVGPYRQVNSFGRLQTGQRFEVEWAVRNLSGDHILVAIEGWSTQSGQPQEIVAVLWDGPASKVDRGSWVVPDLRGYDVLFENRNSNTSNPESWNHSIDLEYAITIVMPIDLTSIRLLYAGLAGAGTGAIITFALRRDAN